MAGPGKARSGIESGELGLKSVTLVELISYRTHSHKSNR